jgi:hypothetical protein
MENGYLDKSKSESQEERERREEVQRYGFWS